MKKIYIVNYKETTLNEDNILDVECGTCDEAFTSEENAIKQVMKLAEDKKCECIDELGYEENEVSITKNYDNACVNCGSNTYEYLVYKVFVD